MARPNSVLALGAIAAALATSGCGDARPIAAGSGSTTSACGACHGDAASASTLSGAHAAHLAPDGVARATCADCHRVPASLGSPGHQDGHVDLAFGARAGGDGARYDAETGTCAVACHGAALAGGPASSPPWRSGGGARLSCSACHGAPPPAPHPAIASCGACHTATVAADGSIIAGGAHLNGQIDVPGVEGLACGTCHAIPPSTGRHQMHVVEKRISCGSCHAGASATSGGAGHMNGTVDVSAPGWNAATQSCANACHGGEAERWFGGD